ncbi:tRNA-uridine aminocarboxypropyltransferase [Clostridium sp.]|uniref:tRNA-uridine aminocarboxypropyltransferase n=1 Tax=Clostridium sp. TaxID=1506 RepID=UPI003F2F2F5D
MKKITSISESCEFCALPLFNCICNDINKVKGKIKFIILSTEKEIKRPSNTARLLKLINNNTEIIKWERTSMSKDLEEYLNNDKYKSYLVFPALNEEDIKRVINTDDLIEENKEIIAILIDGTWQETKKIIRKSPYLNKLPLISLNIEESSSFDIRRGVKEGTLCTIEAAMEVMKLIGETKEAEIIKEDFQLFLKSYKAGRSGHKV